MLLNFLCQSSASDLLRLAILKIKNKISSINSKEEGKIKRDEKLDFQPHPPGNQWSFDADS